jgi:hypothetical protein
MAERAEKQYKLALVRQLYKKACRASYYAKQEVAERNGLRGYFYSLKYHWLFRAVLESLPNWQNVFEISVDYEKWLVRVRLKTKAENKGLHMPVLGVEQYMCFLHRYDEFVYLDLKEVFWEALNACEAQRWEESWKSEERRRRRTRHIHSTSWS